jgi:hypothetical protein
MKIMAVEAKNIYNLGEGSSEEMPSGFRPSSKKLESC